ncbi:hypothetical protein D3C79_792020 [compost metagenome]
MAAASASSLADARPYFSLKVAPHAAPVPWPPDKEIEPDNKPIKGSSPSVLARAIPMAFWTSSSPVTASRKIPTMRPPFFKLAISALKPMVAKKANIKGVCSEVSN